MAHVITLATSAFTTASPVLNFVSVPSYIKLGATVTGPGIPSDSYIVSFTTFTITINKNVTIAPGVTLTITDNAGAINRFNSDYKIQVPDSGTIILDTGTNLGQVFITGNLNVQGDTTTVNTVNMEIEDNIILLNKGESGSGVTEITSGIEVERNTAVKGNAQILWNENILYLNPATGITESGLWVFQTKAGNAVVGIRTNSIDTNGQNLALINKSFGVITVTGTSDYEEQIINYNSTLEAWDDDYVPNIKAVIDKINYNILNDPSDKIRRDDTQVIVYDNNIGKKITSFDTNGATSTNVYVHHFLITNIELNIGIGSTVTITNSGNSNLNGTWTVIAADPLWQYFIIAISASVTLSNYTYTGVNVFVNNSKSNAKVYVDGGLIAEFQDNHTDIYGIRFSDTTISTTTSNTDLILTSEGTGSVQIQDNLKLSHVGTPPSNPPSGTLKIYSNIEGAGGTGIYFVNDTFAVNVGDNRRDELISKKKAIAFSILM